MQAPGQSGQTDPDTQEEHCAIDVVHPGGIVGLPVAGLAERKETGCQETDSPPNEDHRGDSPTARAETRGESRAEDHHQDGEDHEIELLDPAVRTGFQGAHSFGDGIVFPISEQALDNEPDGKKQRSNNAGDRSNRDEVPFANPAGQLRGRLLLCCHAWTLGRKRMSGIGASTQA